MTTKSKHVSAVARYEINEFNNFALFVFSPLELDVAVFAQSTLEIQLEILFRFGRTSTAAAWVSLVVATDGNQLLYSTTQIRRRSDLQLC